MNEALNYAQQQADTFKNSLQYLIEQQNQQKMLDQQALTQRYTNLVNQINQQKTPIQERYSQDTQGAYVNKMLAGKQLEQSLSQMGLNTQGFGVTQQMMNENAYGQTLGDLAMNRNTQLQNLENQTANVYGQQQEDLLSLDATYANRLADINKYITESTQQKYNTEYARKLDEIRYQEQLKQQAADNAYRVKALKPYGGNTTFDDTPITKEPVVDPIPKITSGVDETNRYDVRARDNYYFANSKQPRYINNKELTNKAKITYGDIFETLSAGDKKRGMSITQNVWTDGTNYYIWSPKDNTYFDITEEAKKQLNKGFSPSKTTPANQKTTALPRYNTSPINYVELPKLGVKK